MLAMWGQSRPFYMADWNRQLPIGLHSSFDGLRKSLRALTGRSHPAAHSYSARDTGRGWRSRAAVAFASQRFPESVCGMQGKQHQLGAGQAASN